LQGEPPSGPAPRPAEPDPDGSGDVPALSHTERVWRFRLETGEPGERGAPLRCRDVQHFHEAVLAADDHRVPLPSRLVLQAPDEATAAWLERWAEDTEHVRRCITIRRADGVEVSLIATIASFGSGVATSLVVESIRLLDDGALHRSGVHSRAEVEAALARYEEASADLDVPAPRMTPLPS
jgi:hypothetical protein